MDGLGHVACHTEPSVGLCRPTRRGAVRAAERIGKAMERTRVVTAALAVAACAGIVAGITSAAVALLAGCVILLGNVLFQAALELRHSGEQRAQIGRQARERYGLSPAGFLCAAQAQPLPHKFAVWESLASRLPELNRTATLRREVEAMPLLSVAPGELDLAALRRARVILTYLVHSIIFGRRVPWERLEDLPPTSTSLLSPLASGAASVGVQPRYVYVPAGEDALPAGGSSLDRSPEPELPESLSTPWRQVSAMLGMPLVLTATDADLWNHSAAVGRAGLRPAAWVSSFRQIVSLTATRSERGFHAVPHAISRAIAPLVPRLLAAPALVRGALRDGGNTRAGSTAELAALCGRLEGALSGARTHLGLIYDEVDASEFFDCMRLLLSGWAVLGDRGLVLPASPAHGLDESCALLVGPSAGQTASLILVDIVLGVPHGPKLAGFQREMRGYMPGALCGSRLHRQRYGSWPIARPW